MISASDNDATRYAIAFGFLATFVSSFGQTFFVGLFSPQFATAADIDGPTVSLLYGMATLASGSLLFWLGGALDRLTLAQAGVLAVGLLGRWIQVPIATRPFCRRTSWGVL